MTPERWKHIQDLFQRALDVADAERTAFLDEACGTDADLRRDVARMLSPTQMSGTVDAAPIPPLDRTLLENYGTDGRVDIGTERNPLLDVTDREDQRPTPPPPLEPGAVVDGKYRIDSVAGRGGMGVVYRAEQLSLKRTVALKVLFGDDRGDPSMVRRFKREAQTVAALKHPNIVAIHDFGFADGVGLYFAMEHLSGRSLRSDLAPRRGLPIPMALDVMRQTLAGVQAAHDAGFVHRDLKPDNIFLETTTGGFTVKVLDFGIATGSFDAAPAEPITQRGAIIGTPAYLSPEQCAGDPVDKRADIYALGCLLYEMLAGRPPFMADTMASMIFKHVAESPEPLASHRPDVPVHVEDAVLRALAKRPGDRFDSAARFALALDDAAGRTSALGHGAPPTLVDHRQPSGPLDVPVSGRATNLPAAATSFIGRDDELARLGAALDQTRLLTLAGPGGIGKTRLALELAKRARDRFEGGVWLADLTALRDASLVDRTIADAFGIRPNPGAATRSLVHDFVGERALLVVLDNCEHLVDGCADSVDALLKACPKARVLATSREPLGVDGETLWRVPPMATAKADGREFGESERLFLARAALARPEILTEPPDPERVVDVCRKLEGIPLAIELAAARMRVLGIEQILAKLDQRFDLLAGGGRTRAPRQQALRTAIDWSFELLSPSERALFRRLSVFAGGWTLDAAVDVCGFGEFDANILDLTVGLIDKSLVLMEDRNGQARYRMLETIREYAAEKLDDAGERDRALWRHTQWFKSFALRANPEINGTQQALWFGRLDAELDNLRAVLGRSIEAGSDDALTLCDAIRFYWYVRGHLTEGRRWFDAALAVGRSAAPLLRASALYGAAGLALGQSDNEQAEKYLDECLALYRALDDDHGVAHTLLRWAFLMQERLEYDRSVALCQDAIDVSERRGDSRTAAVALYYTGRAEIARGRLDAAEQWFHQSMAIQRREDHQRGVAILLHSFGELAYLRGALDEAERTLDECIAIAAEIGDERILADSRHMLGCVATARGDVVRALDLQRKAIGVYQSTGDSQGVAYGIEGVADAALAADDAETALMLFEAAERIRAVTHTQISPSERALTDASVERALKALDRASVERARLRGQSLTEDQAARAALDWVPPLGPRNR